MRPRSTATTVPGTASSWLGRSFVRGRDPRLLQTGGEALEIDAPVRADLAIGDERRPHLVHDHRAELEAEVFELVRRIECLLHGHLL